jgi:tetratricopeptide (TPR) repeat protein
VQIIDPLRRIVTRLRLLGSERTFTRASVAPPSGDAVFLADYQRSFESASAAFRAGNYEQAAVRFQDCVELRHDDADAHLNLGLSYQRLGKPDDAADSFALALCYREDFPEVHFNLGVVELERGAYERAADAFEAAIRLRPEYAEALNNLGYVQFNYLGQVFEGEANINRALQLKPDFVDARCNLGLLFHQQGRFDEALTAYDEALRQQPGLDEARLDRALLWLAQGDFARGWPEYEARKKGSAHFTPRDYAVPEWDGAPSRDATVLVYGEQGLGDEIMFASCLPDVIGRVGRCVIDCSPKLEKLYQRSFPGATVHGGPQSGADLAWLKKVAPVDFQIAIGSLPLHYRKSLESFPAHRGYLLADSGKIAAWRRKLAGVPGTRKVGISWRGGTKQTRQSARSIPLDEWLPILSCEDTAFISLQYTECSAELADLERAHGVRVHHWQEAIVDYDETAALMSALDLVLSVQTAAVHLAGALGRSAWVMVSASPEWRYLRTGATLPWYPALRIFRQRKLGYWQDVIEQVVAELRRTA